MDHNGVSGARKKGTTVCDGQSGSALLVGATNDGGTNSLDPSTLVFIPDAGAGVPVSA